MGNWRVTDTSKNKIALLFAWHSVAAWCLNKLARLGSKLMARAGTASNVHEVARDEYKAQL